MNNHHDIVYVIKNADKGLPDSPDYWLANDKVQEGKPVWCRVEGKDAIGYFYRSKNKLWFSYVFYEKIVDDSPFDAFWSDNSDGQLRMEDFGKIDWLEPLKDVFVFENKFELMQLLNDVLIEYDFSSIKDRHQFITTFLENKNIK